MKKNKLTKRTKFETVPSLSAAPKIRKNITKRRYVIDYFHVCRKCKVRSLKESLDTLMTKIERKDCTKCGKRMMLVIREYDKERKT